MDNTQRKYYEEELLNLATEGSDLTDKIINVIKVDLGFSYSMFTFIIDYFKDLESQNKRSSQVMKEYLGFDNIHKIQQFLDGISQLEKDLKFDLLSSEQIKEKLDINVSDLTIEEFHTLVSLSNIHFTNSVNSIDELCDQLEVIDEEFTQVLDLLSIKNQDGNFEYNLETLNEEQQKQIEIYVTEVNQVAQFMDNCNEIFEFINDDQDVYTL